MPALWRNCRRLLSKARRALLGPDRCAFATGREPNGCNFIGRVPTMLSAEETQLLQRLTRECYTGRGTILDCGPFLGGSTSALCAGLLESPAAATKKGFVHSFDRFIYESFFGYWFIAFKGPWEEGDSFLPLFRRLTSPYRRFQTIHAGDIRKASYRGGPVEILFNDVCKSWEINDAVVAKFFPHLIPGQSVVIQQDYLHFFAYWLVITMDFFRDYFEPAERVADGHTAVFRCTRRIPDAALRVNLRTLPVERKREAFERELARTTGWQHTEIQVAYARMLLDEGDTAGARAVLRRIDPAAHEHPMNKVGLTFIPPEYLAA
jgi:hypothetical protein